MHLGQYHIWIMSFNYNRFVWQPDLKSVYIFWSELKFNHPGFYTKGRPLVKSNLICSSDKLSWQRGCPVLNIKIQGNFCISHGNGSSDNLPENLV